MQEHSEIPRRLKAIRERAGLSIREMARRVRMSSSGYSHYELPDRFKEATLPLAQAKLFAEAMKGTRVNPAEVMALAGIAPLISAKEQAAPLGFAETARPYDLRAHPPSPESHLPHLHAIFGPDIATPGTFEIGIDLPAFALLAGDIVLVDLSRLPNAGELTLVSMFDENLATATWTIARYFPPFLQCGFQSGENIPLRVDQPGVTVRHPVIGSLRGIPRKD